MRGAGLILCAALLGACASTRATSPVGVTMNLPPSGEKPPEPPKKPVPEDVVARAAQPFRARRNADGAELARRQLEDELSRYDVLCLGESHDSARDHAAELAIIEALTRRARISGRALGVGFEMFQAPYAHTLRAYAQGRVDDEVLRERTHYDSRWGFPYAYYRPLLAYGRARGLSLVALNAPSELTHAVAEKGLADLTRREKELLPKLVLNDREHRAQFDRLMANHPDSAGMNLDNFYAAQVVWDETMAQNAAAWLDARAPQRQLVVLAGSAHCRQEAIPARIERRTQARVGNVLLSASSTADSAGYDYTLLFGAAAPNEPSSGDDR